MSTAGPGRFYAFVRSTTRGNVIKTTNLWRHPFLVVDNNTPSKVKLLVFDLDEAPRAHEGKGVGRVCHNLSEIGIHPVELLSIFVVLSNHIFIRDDNCILCFLLLPQL